MAIPRSGFSRYLNNRSTGKLGVCILFALAFLLSSGCFTPRVDLASYNLRTVAVVMAQLKTEKQLKGVPDGKGSGASRSAGSAVGSLWKGCGKIVGSMAGSRELGLFVSIGTMVVCVGLTPVVGTSAAVVGAYKADSSSEVDRIKQELQENLPDPKAAVVVFEQALLDPSQRNDDCTFRIGTEYGLNEIRPDADYRPLAPKGIDAVLEIDALIVALNGKDLRSPFFLEVCTPVKLIYTKDNTVLFTDTSCRTSDSRDLNTWSADHWSALKIETVSGLRELGGQYLYRMVFP